MTLEQSYRTAKQFTEAANVADSHAASIGEVGGLDGLYTGDSARAQSEEIHDGSSDGAFRIQSDPVTDEGAAVPILADLTSESLLEAVEAVGSLTLVVQSLSEDQRDQLRQSPEVLGAALSRTGDPKDALTGVLLIANDPLWVMGLVYEYAPDVLYTPAFEQWFRADAQSALIETLAAGESVGE